MGCKIITMLSILALLLSLSLLLLASSTTCTRVAETLLITYIYISIM
ncbi:hypothetical protein E1A91_A10G146800v1 [Gossypium mustelinum]|uniref:Uncharacterized protein n=1 Tax=Gossypium mustelinum TaxID=34275 RepID=A0A5D2XLJ4_GOSMU|nr:hypothetical protein E1A91_A10G146800v1 [Gossypium mustelinum]